MSKGRHGSDAPLVNAEIRTVHTRGSTVNKAATPDERTTQFHFSGVVANDFKGRPSSDELLLSNLAADGLRRFDFSRLEASPDGCTDVLSTGGAATSAGCRQRQFCSGCCARLRPGCGTATMKTTTGGTPSAAFREQLPSRPWWRPTAPSSRTWRDLRAHPVAA